MISRDFDAITKADIEALVTNAVAEGRTIEYKQQLPGDGDDDKREFLADISSFANTGGGDVIYGITEKRDGSKATGTPENVAGLAGISTDIQIRRLDEIIRSGIDPRIPGVRIRCIDGFNSGPVLVIRVPKSWASPHMVKFKNASRFFARNSAGKYQLDVTEIRSAFMASGDLRTRITVFHRERLSKIFANEAPVVLIPDPKVVLHLVPVTLLDPSIQLNLQPLRENVNLTKPMLSQSFGHRFNLDGFLSYGLYRSGDDYRGYVQVFRSGVIESVSANLLRTPGDDNCVPANGLENEIIKAMKIYSGTANHLGVLPPLIVTVAMHGIKGFWLKTASMWEDKTKVFDRDTLLLPDVLLEDYNAPADLVLKPIFDAFWQSAGFAFCQHYNAQGKWDGGKSLMTPE